MLKLSRLLYKARRRMIAAGIGALGMMAGSSGSGSADERFLAQLHSSHVAGVENFDAADRFRIDSLIGGRRLVVVGYNFKEHFLAIAESRAPSAVLAASELRYTMGDTSLIKFIDAEKVPVAHLAHVYAIMEMGEAGASHVDWQSNIAYLRSPVDHRLWAVHWSVNHRGEWTVGAVNVPHAALDWAAGTRVFSVARSPRPTSLVQTRARVGE